MTKSPPDSLCDTAVRMPAIAPTLSLYLDLVRFLASVSVVLYHSWGFFYPDSRIKWPGHEAVVVFFVLSGYVIAYAATRPGVTASTYLVHRLARIVPVAWLALLVGLVLSLYVTPRGAWPALALPTAANLLFVGHTGWAFLIAPLNEPFWSLNYEVWYYVIFGCWLFAPQRWRLLLTSLALLGAGPKVLLLFPVWLYGVWLYRRMPAMTISTAVVVFTVTLAAGALGTWLNLSDVLRTALYTAFPPAWHLHFSTQFLYDLLLGIAVTFNFAAVSALAPALVVPAGLSRAIRTLAGYTFSLYVFHLPLVTFLTDVCHVTSAWLFYVLMAALVYVLGQLTEQRTGWFRARLSRRHRIALPVRPAGR